MSRVLVFAVDRHGWTWHATLEDPSKLPRWIVATLDAGLAVELRSPSPGRRDITA